MRNRKLALAVFSLSFFLLSSCNGSDISSSPSLPSSTTPSSSLPSSQVSSTSGESSSSLSSESSTSSEEVSITKVEINGPKSVYVGESITLTAGVTGDRENQVTWESLDPTIASVDETGKVTGLEEGEATIRATSVLDPSVHGDYVVTVSTKQETPTVLTPSLTGENVVYEEETKTYAVEVYTEFDVHYELDVQNPVAPYSAVTYRLLTDSSTGASYEQYVHIDAATGHGEVLLPLEDTILTIQVAYPLSSENTLYGNISIRIRDSKAELLSDISTRLEKANEAEKDSAVEADVTRTKRTSDGEDEIDKSIHYDYFEDAVYAQIEDRNSSNTSYGGSNVTNAYSGIQNDHFYNFLYTSSYGRSTISDVFAKDETGTGDEDRADLPYNYDAQNAYGLVENVLYLLENDGYLGASTISGEEAKKNLTVNESDSSIALLSVFDSTDLGGDNHHNRVSLTLSFDEEERLTYYAFSSTTWTTAEGNTAIETSLNEEASIDYGTKSDDSLYASRVNIDSFLASGALYLSNAGGSRDSNGAYDFTDTSHYLEPSYQPTQEEYEGQSYPVYAFDYTMAFAFRLNPSGGSLDLDEVKIDVTPISATILDSQTNEKTESENPLAVVQVAEIQTGIFVTSDNFTNTGDYVLGDSLVTLTTSKGIQTSFIARVTDVGEPTSLRIQMPSGTQGNDFGDIRVGSRTGTFIINATPDATYTFTIDVTDATTGLPVEDALSLEKPMDVTSGTTGYVLQASEKPGSYKVVFGIEGYEMKTDPYTITVLPALTEEEIAENILSRSFDYEYNSSYTGATLSFDTDTKTATFVQNNSDIEWTDTFSYRIEEGQLYFEGGEENADLGEGTYLQLGQNITSETKPSTPYQNPSYGYLRTDVPVTISTDMESLSLSLAQYNYNYINEVRFVLHYDNALLKYAFTGSYYKNGTNYSVEAQFDEEGTGRFLFQDSTGTSLGQASFSYTLEGQVVTLTNIVFNFENDFSWPESLSGTFNDYTTSASLYFTINSTPYETISFSGR